MTLIPKPPKTVMVFRSAWMPAPPPESEPAMVNILLIPFKTISFVLSGPAPD